MHRQGSATIECSWRRFLIYIIPALLLATTALGATGGAESPERVLVAAPAVTPPAIDGKLDDPCWKSAESTCPFDVLPTAHPTLAGLFLQPDKKFVENAATAQVCFDDKNLYVAFRAPVPDGMQPKADAKGHDGQVRADDCVELFLDPLSGGGFYQMIANAGDAFADWSAAPGSGTTSAWASKALVKSRRDAKGFCVEMAIPFASLGAVDRAPGSSWKVNFTRSGATAGGRSTWAPVGEAFATPSRFGILIFASRKAYLFQVLAKTEKTLESVSAQGQEAMKADVGKKLAELKQKIEREGDQPSAWVPIRASLDEAERNIGSIAVAGRAYMFWQKDVFVVGGVLPSEKIATNTVVLEQLQIQAAQNMRAQSGFLISNLSGKPLLGRFRVKKLKDGKPAADGSKVLDSKRLRLFRGLYLEQQGGAMIPDVLLPLPYFNLLEAPAGGTVLLLLEVDTHNLEPGRYTHEIEFLPSYSGFEPATLKLAVDVAPIDLAKPFVPAFVYSSDVNAGRYPLVAEDMVRHGVTTIYCMPENRQNTATFDADGRMVSNNWVQFEQTLDTMIAKAGGDTKKLDVLVYFGWNAAWYRDMGIEGTRLSFGTEKWKRAFKSYLTTLRDVIMKRGFGYDRIAIKTLDEPYGDPSDPKTSGSIAIQGARYIKEVDPKLRTMCNPNVDAKNGKYMPSYFEVYDIIQPYLGQLQANPAALDELRRSGKELWGYLISGRGGLPSWYRDMWWFCAKNGFAGGNGFWAYCFFSGDPFNSYDLQGGYAGMTADYGVAYYMSGAEALFDGADHAMPLSSLRWEAWYQGVLDFRTIAVCRELIAGLKAAGKTDAAKVYDDKLTEIIKKTQGKSCLAMDQARESLLRMAVELQRDAAATP